MWALRKHIYTEYTYICNIYLLEQLLHALIRQSRGRKWVLESAGKQLPRAPKHESPLMSACCALWVYAYIIISYVFVYIYILYIFICVCVYGIVFINSCMFIQHYTCMRACCAFLVNSPTWYGPPKPLSRFVVVAVLVLQLRILVLVVLLVQ